MDNVMSAHKVSRFAVKANEQGTELVNPGEGSLSGETQLVDFRVEEPFRSAFGLFARTLVFDNVGNDLGVEARPAGGFGIKSGIGVEIATDNRNAEPLDELEGRTERVFQLEGIVVVACDYPGGCQNEPIGIGNGQYVGGFGFLASLIGHRLTAFLGRGVAAVQVEVMRIDLLMNIQNAVLKDRSRLPS
jgi:hypothetical protein